MNSLGLLSRTRHTLIVRRFVGHQTQSENLKIFRENATKWWDGEEFRILRSMNKLRVPFITNGLQTNDAKIIDVGCGGGILAEALARVGGNVLGIDPVTESIEQARLHSQQDPSLEKRLNYKNCNLQDLVTDPQHVGAYDCLVASEVLEHVVDVEGFLVNCTKLLKPNGNLFITTINQTPLSWLGVIFMGEYVLKQLPKGTHTYDMFVNVKGLRVMLERLGYHIRLINGFMYEPVGGNFYWTPTTLTHYAVHAIKHNSPGNNTNGGMLNYGQHRTLASSSRKKITKPKKVPDMDDMMLVIPIDEFESKCDTILANLKKLFEENLTLRTSTSSFERLKIELEDLNEPLELRELAQISIKSNKLIVINLSGMPEAIKPTVKALLANGNSNYQVEVNHIYLPVPKVTQEHRKNLADSADKFAKDAKTKLKQVYSEFSSKSRGASKQPGVSEDLIRQTVEYLQYDVNKRCQDIDSMLETKSKQLFNR